MREQKSRSNSHHEKFIKNIVKKGLSPPKINELKKYVEKKIGQSKRDSMIFVDRKLSDELKFRMRPHLNIEKGENESDINS